MIIVADASALFAAFDADQEEHQQAPSVMEHETLIISPLVLTELDHLTRRDLGFSAAMKITDATSVSRSARGESTSEVKAHATRTRSPVSVIACS